MRAADADGTGDLSLPEFSSVVLAARRAHEDAALAADDECACHSENAFRILDGDDSGAVSAGEIEALLAGAVAVSAAELEELCHSHSELRTAVARVSLNNCRV